MSDRIKHKIHSSFLAHIQRTPYQVVVPNFYYGRFEMDVFKLTKDGYIHEFEIKISRGDFQADFLKNYVARSHYGYDADITRIFKHDLIKSGKAANRFYFVAPEDTLSISDIPEYAGLISYTKYESFNEVKHAPMLHKNKVDDSYYKQLSMSLSFRENNLRNKLNRIQRNA